MNISHLRCKNTSGAHVLFIFLLLSLQFPLHATVFVTSKSGNYNHQEIWKPYYPGNIIKESDTVVITNAIEQNVDVVVKGTIVIKETGSLIGDKNIIIVKSGTLLNLGKSKFGLLTNRGAIYNQQTLEVSLDFVNSGNVINHKNIEVGNMLDNTGLLTGKGGDISANGRFVNSRTGSIKGNLDVCSNNFLNVEGGSVDTENTTFCGNPILSSSTVVSQNSAPLHFEKSQMNVSLRTGDYLPF